MLNEETIKHLKELADRRTGPEAAEANGEEYYIAGDYAGGNFDDAYENGCADGETAVARYVLDALGLK